MCGRYYVDDETAHEIEKLVRDIDAKMAALGDVRPTDSATVIKAADNINSIGSGISAGIQSWGFPQPSGSGIIFNARCESIEEKPMFCDAIHSRRAIIPAHAFYEWNRSKNKFTFVRKDGAPIYMAGCWKSLGDHEVFVIITTAANESMQQVHDRMPLIFEKTQIEDWILDSGATPALLRQRSPLLDKASDFCQLELFNDNH